MKTVYLFDAETKRFTGSYSAQESPLEPGVYVTPVCSVDVPPPVPASVWVDGEWQPVTLVFEGVQPPSLGEVKAAAIASVREARKPVFYTLAGMQSEALATGDSATATAIVAIQQALKDLPETDLSACVNAAEVGSAFVAAWQAIADMAPANVVSAFNEVLA